jgi:hypothetical protein
MFGIGIIIGVRYMKLKNLKTRVKKIISKR